MKLKVDGNSRVLNFSIEDNFDGAVDIQLDRDVEQEFIYQFEPKKYIFKDGKLIEDVNFHNKIDVTQSENNVEVKTDSATQLALGAISKQVADLTKQNTTLQQSLGALALQLAKEEK